MLDSFASMGLQGKSPLTVKTYHHALLQFERWLIAKGTDLSDYTRKDVQHYLNELVAKKKEASTVNKVWNAIKKYSKFVGNHEAIADVNVIQPENPLDTAPKSLNKKEVLTLEREVCRDGDKRNEAIVTLLLNTGVRVSELVSINLADVHMSERKGSVRVRGKGNRQRTVQLNAEARRAIQRYLKERSDSNPALFLSNRGDRISVRSVQYLLNQYGVYPHQLRHSFITDLVRSGSDLPLIQSMTGHKNINMLMRYSKPNEEDKIKAVETLYTH